MKMDQNMIGESISFTYNGRPVRCVVDRLTKTGFVGIMQNDYYGKNEAWLIGDAIHFVNKIINKK